MSRRVLVVEDDPEFAGLLALWLERAGMSPRVAATGSEAMRAVYDDRPDLVTLDVGLPQLDGWQLCGRIREFSDVPILIVSARARRPTAFAGSSSGPTTTSPSPSRSASSWLAWRLHSGGPPCLRRGTDTKSCGIATC